MAEPDALPEPDRAGAAPHPRHALELFGQDAAEAAFLDAFTSDRLHHGWLLTGPKGIGKSTFAWRAARFLLSQPVDDGGLFGAPTPPTSLTIDPETPLAHRMAALSEPGLFLLRRPWDDKAKRLKADITVDEVRKLQGFFALSAADGGRRAVIVDAADEMNTAAANALLKVLEEPPARTTLFLIAHQPARLLPTIRSRCRTLRLNPLDPDAMGRALRQAGHDGTLDAGVTTLAQGSAGAALRLVDQGGAAAYAALVNLWQSGPAHRQGAIAMAEGCAGAAKADHYRLVLDLINTFLARLARAGLTGPPTPEAAPNEAQILARLSPHDRAARGWAALQADLSARATHGRAVNLDPAALVLDILLSIDKEARAHSL